MSSLSNIELTTTINEICKLTKLKPDQSTVRNIMIFVKNKNISLLRTRYDALMPDEASKALTSYIADLYIQKLKPVDVNNSTYEEEAGVSYEQLKKIVYDKKFLDYTAMRKYDRSNWSTTNIWIDSRYQDLSNSDRTLIKLNIVPKSNSGGIPDGSIISNSNLRNVTQMHLNSFTIPYQSDLNYFQTITMTFAALASNSISMKNTFFHFNFNYTVCSYNSKLIYLTPTRQTFTFNPPITNLEDISLRFNDPEIPIKFDKDRLKSTSVTYNVPNVGIFTFGDFHYLQNNDIVIIEGLTTINPSENIDLLNRINNPRGHKATVLDDNRISIPIQFSDLINIDVNSLPVVYFYSKRIAFHLKIHYINNTEQY